MCGVAILPMAFVGLLTLIVVLAVMGGQAFAKVQKENEKERRELDRIRADIARDVERERNIQMRRELDSYKEQLRKELIELNKASDNKKYDAITNYLRSQDNRYNIKREEPILLEVK